jgi:tRNA 2-selenouridine synthase
MVLGRHVISADEAIAMVAKGIASIDVRAEVEFGSGTLPGSFNLPILNTDERRLVGTCYKENGSAAAVALGEKLVSGDKKLERVHAWRDFLRQRPDSFLFCFRGGMRSQYAQDWLSSEGINVARVTGGYKACRRHFVRYLANASAYDRFLVVSGRTGSGKTALLRSLGPQVNFIDLEKLANHRGSTFGATGSPQPSQADFENRLALHLMGVKTNHTVLIEDESRLIGSCCLPESFVQKKLVAPVVYIDDPVAARAERIYQEYVAEPVQTSDPFTVRDALLGSLNKIKNRLGGVRHQAVAAQVTAAFARHGEAVSPEMHRAWITDLLKFYYDPQYDYYLEKKIGRIEFRGTHLEVAGYLAERMQRIPFVT